MPETIRLEVLLLSGRGVAAQADVGTTVKQMRTMVQKRLQVGIEKLVHQDRILPDAMTLQEAGLQDGDIVVATLQAAQILSCRQCPSFFLVRGDGRVATWGDLSLGVPRQLRNPQQVVGCKKAMAALVDGQVITWGHMKYRPPKELMGQLQELQELCATDDAFATLRRDGQVICWGDGRMAVPRLVQQLLGDVQLLAASLGAFMAIRKDGRSAVSWGSSQHGAVPGHLLPPLQCGAQQLVATGRSFAVLQEDGLVVSLDRSSRTLLEDVNHLCASEDTLVGLRKDGTVVTWSNNQKTVVDSLSNVTQVVATRYAFAALKRDGTVSVWGHPRFGGDTQAVRKLKDVQQLHASSAAFAAVRAGGSVATWGDERCGGNATGLAKQLSDVRRLCRFKRRFFEIEE